jgi:hypothetical protein
VRVFYASSPLAKEAGSWLPYTGLHFHGVDFTRYGLLAIFFPQTFLGETVSSITETDGGDLLIQLRETGCSVGPLPKRRWIFLYMFLDKTTLRIAPKRLFVLSP